MAGHHRSDRRIEHSGIAQPRVSVTGRKGGRDCASGSGSAEAATLIERGSCSGVGRVLFRQQTAGVIAAGAGQVGVDIHPSRHYDHPRDVQPRGTLWQALHDAPVFNADVAHFTIHTVGWVVNRSAGDSELRSGAHRWLRLRPPFTSSRSARRTSVADR
jgi:hypothetical protein